VDIRLRALSATITVLTFGAVVSCTVRAQGAATTISTTHQAVSTTTPGTNVVNYQPWTATGLASGISESHSVVGNCWTTSIAVPRNDAYRCMNDNSEIYDPCFASTSPSEGAVACPFPGPSAVTLIRLNQPLPPSNSTQSGTGDNSALPWLLVLVDGQQCNTITGTTELINGMPSSYSCPNGLLYGNPNRNTSEWTIYYQPNGSQTLTSVSVKSAYR
jgi:hypothetical protein